MVEYTVCYTIPQVHTAHINTTFIFLHDPLLCNQLWCARNSQSDSENISWIQVMSFVVVNNAAQYGFSRNPGCQAPGIKGQCLHVYQLICHCNSLLAKHTGFRYSAVEKAGFLKKTAGCRPWKPGVCNRQHSGPLAECWFSHTLTILIKLTLFLIKLLFLI